MDLEHLPVIDWDIGTKLAGNKREFAKEMLTMLCQTLPDDIHAILTCHLQQDFTSLKQRLHKLHGALCYCGAPRLKAVVVQLESNLKNNIMDTLPSLLQQLDHEAKQLVAHCSRPA